MCGGGGGGGGGGGVCVCVCVCVCACVRVSRYYHRAQLREVTTQGALTVKVDRSVLALLLWCSCSLALPPQPLPLRILPAPRVCPPSLHYNFLGVFYPQKAGQHHHLMAPSEVRVCRCVPVEV